MTEKWKNYTIIVLSAVLLASIGFNAMPDSTHYCESRELKAYCFEISSTMKTCYTLPNKAGGKICSDLWKEIPDEAEQAVVQSPYVIAYTDNGKWFCDKVGVNAKCVMDNSLEMPIY